MGRKIYEKKLRHGTRVAVEASTFSAIAKLHFMAVFQRAPAGADQACAWIIFC